jgi:hypothetical protein
MFAKQINATTISVPSSHASVLSHPNEVAKFARKTIKRIDNAITLPSADVYKVTVKFDSITVNDNHDGLF